MLKLCSLFYSWEESFCIVQMLTRQAKRKSRMHCWPTTGLFLCLIPAVVSLRSESHAILLLACFHFELLAVRVISWLVHQNYCKPCSMHSSPLWLIVCRLIGGIVLSSLLSWSLVLCFLTFRTNSWGRDSSTPTLRCLLVIPLHLNLREKMKKPWTKCYRPYRTSLCFSEFVGVVARMPLYVLRD